VNRAIFLDRDGVINSNEDPSGKELVKEIIAKDDIKIYSGVENFLKTAKEKEFKLIVVTNQSKVGRGVITLEELHEINNLIHNLTGKHIHQFYFCPHKKEDGCDCKKPKIGMIKQAAEEHSIDLKNSWMIGDNTIDIKTGRDAGMKTILVRTGYGGRDNQFDVKPDYIAENLEEAGKIIFSS
jgi:histidinol-phosphate phosphatase family protein